MANFHRLCFLAAIITSICAALSDGEESVLLRNDVTTRSNEGKLFVLGFMGITGNGFDIRNPIATLFITTNDPNNARITILVPNRRQDMGFSDYPQFLTITRGINFRVDFPSGISGGPDVRVNGPGDRSNGIVLQSTADVSVIGVNSGSATTDGFLALPCIDFNSADGSSNLVEYKYFIFSALFSSTPTLPFKSRILIVTCEDNNNGITITLPNDRGTIYVQSLQLYETYLFEQEGDLTGAVVSSRTILSVFSGHECGQVPSNATACDHLVEQIPAHAVYGTMFFAVPFALRESGDIFRIGSVTDDNEVSITCTRRTAAGSMSIVTSSATIDDGGFHEHRTMIRSDVPGLRSTDYRRDFCCIETSKPAIVMQYSLGGSEDWVFVSDISGRIGDPAMSLVPPVEQYSNSYTVHTFDDVVEESEFKSFLSLAISSEFLNPGIDQNLTLNGIPYPPPPRSVFGSDEYVAIHCKNQEICGYGAFGPISVGDTTISYESLGENNPGVCASIYGFARENSYAFPAGYQCEPIGLPRIHVFDVIVSEQEGNVIVPFNRTGGDLSYPSRVKASSRDVEGGLAVAGSDYEEVLQRRVRWKPNKVDPRNDTANDAPFIIVIVDDDIEEPTEYFEVYFTVETTGFAFPDAVARVTILDDDEAAMCWFQVAHKTVDEDIGSFIIYIQTSDASSVESSCVISTVPITATAGVDYLTPTTVPVMSDNSFLEAVIEVRDDNITERPESFRIVLNTTSCPEVIIPGGAEITVTIIDKTAIQIGFDSATYTLSETDGVANLTIVKVGIIDRDIDITFITQDLTASSGIFNGNADYTDVSRIITFPQDESTITIPIPISADGLVEGSENFTALIFMSPVDEQVVIDIQEALVTIEDSTTKSDVKEIPGGLSSGIITAISVVSAVAVLILIVTISAVIVCARRGNKSSSDGITGAVLDSDNKYELTSMRVRKTYRKSVPKELIIHSCDLQLNEPVGQGEFGIVYKAWLCKGPSTEVVAVKTLKGFLEQGLVRDLLKECTLMATLDHPNVLTLIGVCVDGGPSPYIVMPFMFNGSLLAHLKRERENLVIPPDRQFDTNAATSKLLNMSLQVAKGMEYLANKRLVHRDLAARNCMIDINYTIKVADFGLSENTGNYKAYFRQDKTKGIKLPVKWLAPECLNDGVFSEKSDVWAFGVTCWEIFSGGKVPYAGINPVDLPQMLENGYRMEMPINSAYTEALSKLMMQCWAKKVEDRPTFSGIVTSLSQNLDMSHGYVDLCIENGNN